MSTSQADGGTRSGLVWEIIRILKECGDNKPQLLLCENVPQIHCSKNVDDFHNLQVELNKLGYVNFWQDMNAVDYTQIPQNRVRTFMLSIYDPSHQATYSFPLKTRLKTHLKDFLQPENEVDKKYYLNEKMINYICADNDKWTGNNEKSLVNKSIASTINTKEGSHRCDASNYILKSDLSLSLQEDVDLKKVVSNKKTANIFVTTDTMKE